MNAKPYAAEELRQWRLDHGPDAHSQFCEDRTSDGACRTERWLATLAEAAPPSRALDVEGVIAELISAETAVETGLHRLRKATVTLAGIASASPTAEPVDREAEDG